MKTSEIVDKSRKLFKTISECSLKFLRSTGKHKIALIALCISIVGSSHITSRFLIYYLYEPKIGVSLGSPEDYFAGITTFEFSEINGAINILHNDMERDIRIEIEFIASKPIRPDPEFPYFKEQGLGGGGFRFMTESFYLPAHSTLGLVYPFEQYYEEFALEVIIYSRMRMNEFGLPRFFGDIDLRPVRKTFTIEP